jgi:hypothetical protein
VKAAEQGENGSGREGRRDRKKERKRKNKTFKQPSHTKIVQEHTKLGQTFRHENSS